MPKSKPERVIYYEDAQNDDFAGTNISACTVDDTFPYLHDSRLWRAVSAILYYGAATPLVWFFMRVILGVRFVGKDAVRSLRGRPCFLYGNHTGFIDAFTPGLLSLPTRNRIIVGADTVSIKGLRSIVQMLGAIPLPTGIKGMRSFSRAIDAHHMDSNITIYPEAHIWPYFTGVRDFPDTSFCYPVKYGAPVVAFFTAYGKPTGLARLWRKASITVYVSDPIYPTEGLSACEARRDLRDKVYAFMQEKSQYSTYEVIKYVRREAEKA